MEASAGPPNRTAVPHQRRGVVFILIAVASLIGFLAVFAIWANRQLLETDTWTNTSSKLLEDPEIRTQVANEMVDTLYANVDVGAELQQALPPRLQPLAAPAAAGIRELALKLANQALERPKVQQLWEDANRAAQENLLNVVEHGGSQPVTLDIGTIVGQLGQQLGVSAADKLPPGVADIQIASNDQLVKVNDGLKLLKTLAWVLTVVALALFALAIYLADGWRREAFRSIGFAFIAIGIAVLVVRSLAGNVVVNAVTSTEAVKPAANNAWSIGTSLLNDQGGAMIFYGLFIVIGAWLSGPMGLARSARRGITPILERRAIAYSALALLLLLLFVWSPTPGFQRLPTALLLIALSIVGLEFLRNRAVKDFPNQTWETATQRWSSSLNSRFGGGT
jgi:anti-sigma regulatory factor (Ser/Thr protein kinase)